VVSSQTTPEHVNQELGTTFHGALIRKDWAGLRTIMSQDVTWTLPGHNQISGTAEGIDAVIARAQLIASYGVSFTLQHVLISRDNMALSLHNEARRGDLLLDEHLATVCRIDDGKITAMETYLSDVDGMNKFFADLP
jgi:ketosteroid isomerase-like protein